MELQNSILDKPGMIEAKILLPNSTSTPLKPFSFDKSAGKTNKECYNTMKTSGFSKFNHNKSMFSIGPFDSGYSSILENSHEATTDDSKDEDQSFSNYNPHSPIDQIKQPSLFESILKSRNHSISLEQLVEKVNLKKEQKSDHYVQVGRSRSFSTSELKKRRESHQSADLQSCSSSNLSLYSDLSVSSTATSGSRWSVEGQSPTLEQALLMGARGRGLASPWDQLPSRRHSGGDYDLSELVASLRRGHPPASSPATPSPEAATFRRTPESLFGLEALQLYPGPATSRPKLERITETELEPSTTPEEYYTTGLSPLPPPPAPCYSGPPVPVPALDPGTAAASEPGSSTWSGLLAPRHHRRPVYSAKIFLGGVPWDVTEASLVQTFSQFGPIRIEWPGKDQSPSPPKGYVYIVFDHERNVSHLLSQCSRNNGAYYFKISSRRMRSKEVQIIPWVLDDSNFIKNPKQKLDPKKTVFVGALHGMLNAEILAKIFNDLFGGVVYAGIDTDKHKYPIGSGRVTFGSTKSYMKAVSAAYVEIKCQQFNKRVQVDPYLEDALCSLCLLKQGPYFCRDLACFQYYCRHCWEAAHSPATSHKPLMRNTRTGGGPATRPAISLTPSQDTNIS